MKRNHSLLEYTRDNDTQVSELGPSGPSCFHFSLLNGESVGILDGVLSTAQSRICF